MKAPNRNANRIQRIMKARIEQARFTRWKRERAAYNRERNESFRLTLPHGSDTLRDQEG